MNFPTLFVPIFPIIISLLHKLLSTKFQYALLGTLFANCTQLFWTLSQCIHITMIKIMVSSIVWPGTHVVPHHFFSLLPHYSIALATIVVGKGNHSWIVFPFWTMASLRLYCLHEESDLLLIINIYSYFHGRSIYKEQCIQSHKMLIPSPLATPYHFSYYSINPIRD